MPYIKNATLLKVLEAADEEVRVSWDHAIASVLGAFVRHFGGCNVCGVWADLLSDFVKTRRGEGTISAKERQSM